MSSSSGEESEESRERRTKLERRKQSLAQVLRPAFLRSIVAQPKKTAIVWGSVNLVFVGIGETISFLCWLLSTPGFLLLVGCGVYATVYNVARAITYPGFLSNVKRSLEKDIAKEVRRSVQRAIQAYSQQINYVCFLWINQKRYFALPRATSKLASLQATALEMREHLLEPMASALLHQRVSAGGRLEYGGEKFLLSLQCLLQVEELVRENLIGPALVGLHSSGMPGFADALREAMEAIDPVDLCEEDIQNVCLPATVLFPETNADELRNYLLENKAKLLEAFVYFLKKTFSTAESLQKHREDEQQQQQQQQQQEEDEKDNGDGADVELGDIKSEKPEDSDVVLEMIDYDDEASPHRREEDEEEMLVQQDIQPHAPLSGTTGGMLQTLRNTLKDYQASRSPMQAIANIDFMRADMESRLGAKQAWVTMRDGTKIDTMFIPCASSEDKKFPDNRTILVCNPNCGIYEFALYQCQWVRFYSQRGINVFLYNYRGYGRSEGWPSPQNHRRDGEDLVKHITATHSVQPGWIGVHAESIGGIVASHLAQHGGELGISYVVADRTFSDLPTTAESMMGAWAGNVMRRLGWVADNTSPFLNAPASVYRVCTCDPSDEIIANAASLKVGVARRLIQLACIDNEGEVDQPDSGLSQVLTMHTNPREDLVPWALDHVFFDRFGTACVSLIEAQREIVGRGVIGPSRLRLLEPIQDIVKLLWFADGLCGQCLGGALAEYHALWKDSPDVQEEDGQDSHAMPNLKSQNPEHIARRVRPVLDWAYSYLVWGNASPPLSTLIGAVSERKHPYNICGEIGYCAPHIPVPLATLVRILDKFLSRYDADLQGAGLKSCVQVILDTVSKLFSCNQSQAAKLSGASPPLALVPLFCGHNGRMSDKEEQVVLQHLKNAGWQSST